MEKKKRGRPALFKGEKCCTVWIPARLKDQVREFVRSFIEQEKKDA